ncbi:unnamed protein product [Miscanthus lutarioriparius]|uniref:VWFA domain-containing protein n=1 Tax=Miscanthus lutarioriparius TaxID=422564 RepID=A0A811RFJ2_9POAL|nr:unnamed protein product [Miscanthus lutarioriparius]
MDGEEENVGPFRRTSARTRRMATRMASALASSDNRAQAALARLEALESDNAGVEVVDLNDDEYGSTDEEDPVLMQKKQSKIMKRKTRQGKALEKRAARSFMDVLQEVSSLEQASLDGDMAAANQVKVSGSLYLPWIRVELKEDTPESKFTAMIRVKAPPVRSNAFPIHLVVALDVCGTTGQPATGPRLDLLEMMKFIKREFKSQGSQSKKKSQGSHAHATRHEVDVATATELVPIANWISAHMSTGGTDLKPDLQRTLEALKTSVNHVGFIILVSDGESKFDSGFDFEKEFGGYPPVHAFGLGRNHDPKVLYDIAKASRGTYSSVPVADTNKVKEAIALCLGGLKSVVAIDTCVKISVPDDTATADTLIIQGMEMVDIQSGGHGKEIKSKGKEGKISVGVLYAGEEKDFIVRLQFRSTTSGNMRTRSSVLTAAVEYYKDISSKLQQRAPTVTEEYKVRLLVTSSNAREAYKDLERQAPNSRVLQQMILFEVVQMLLSFAEEEEEAKAKAKAEAKTTTNINDANVGNLRKRWDDKLKSQGNLLRMARENDLVDLQRIDEAMAAMVSSLEGGSGLGCIYSWVSSCQMQRATTTGLPVPPPFRLTRAMEAAARNVFDKWDESRRRDAASILETLNFGNKVHEAVKAAIEGGGTRTTTTTSGSGDNKEMPAAATTLDDDLKDDIKSTIAIRLFDCCIELKKSSSKDDSLKIYKAAQVAINYWRRVQGKSLPAPAASEAAPGTSPSSASSPPAGTQAAGGHHKKQC